MIGIIERKHNGAPTVLTTQRESAVEDVKNWFAAHPKEAAQTLARLEENKEQYEAESVRRRADMEAHAAKSIDGWQTSTRYPNMIKRQIHLLNGGSLSEGFRLTEGETLESACLAADDMLRAQGWDIPVVEAYEIKEIE